MRLPWSVSCVCARACVSVGETEISGCVRVGVSVSGGDMVYGRGCEGGQDENIDYTCAEY